MANDLNLSRAFGKYIVYLFASLLVAIVIGIFLGEDPEPRTPERLALIIVFFGTFTVLFLWDTGYLKR
ncbi:hypothetical protein [Halorubrum aethiopicum]|uniref:hypothetical protein n=1 Tax=Halorubrum aethiopicum TaxID=1758255 RepID=UPI0008349425|nr:hypothetical protein [Halorubrum aethiopicum]